MPQGNENGNAEEHAGGAIEFWFDFGSSYAYFAAMELDAHGLDGQGVDDGWVVVGRVAGDGGLGEVAGESISGA